MPRNTLYAGAIVLLAFALWLAGCRGLALPTPATESPEATMVTSTRPVEPTPIPRQALQAELQCFPPYSYEAISAEEYTWAISVLENIEPGTTTLAEVRRLLGEPTHQGSECWSCWGYEPFSDTGTDLLVLYSEETVVSVSLFSSMTLGQLIEMYGEPSRVFRSSYAEDLSEGRPRTILFYDERHMIAQIGQGLCEFPPEVVVGDLIVFQPGEDMEWHTLAPDAVEIEWPGLATE